MFYKSQNRLFNKAFAKDLLKVVQMSSYFTRNCATSKDITIKR